MRGLFLALPAILLSPKRAMRQSVLRTDTQPLGTCRQPLDAVGRLILLSPKRAMRQLCSLRSHNAQPLGTGRQPLNAVGRDSFPIQQRKMEAFADGLIFCHSLN